MASPTYLRAVVTGKCPLACGYCHMEGDRPDAPRAINELTTSQWITVLRAAVGNGVRKVKLLGGEPLVRGDLPRIIAGLRQAAPDVDISLITSGVAPVRQLLACFVAGLSRANMSVHGFGLAAFQARGGSPAMHGRREVFLHALLGAGRPVKLNYVYTGSSDTGDLGALLDWAADKPAVVNVLDDLGNPDLGPSALLEVVTRLRGFPRRSWLDEDPDSLPTRHLRWADGLEVEIKDSHLGDLAPWSACASCPRKANCREGIHALRVSRAGDLRACMDRPDLRVDLTPFLGTGDEGLLARNWRRALQELDRPAAACQARSPLCVLPA